METKHPDMDHIVRWLEAITVLGVMTVMMLSFLTFNFLTTSSQSLKSDVVPEGPVPSFDLCAVGYHVVYTYSVPSCEPDPVCTDGKRACCPKDNDITDNQSPLCFCISQNQVCSARTNPMNDSNKLR